MYKKEDKVYKIVGDVEDLCSYCSNNEECETLHQLELLQEEKEISAVITDCLIFEAEEIVNGECPLCHKVNLFCEWENMTKITRYRYSEKYPKEIMLDEGWKDEIYVCPKCQKGVHGGKIVIEREE